MPREVHGGAQRVHRVDRGVWADELLYGLQLAVSAALVTELLAMVGIVSTPFDGDLLTTLRHAVREAQDLGVNPTALAYVLSPADWETAETTQAVGSDQYQFGVAGAPVLSDVKC